MRTGSPLTRRRALHITAAACGAALLPIPATARLGGLSAVSWRGIALGAPAEINLYADDERSARRALEGAVREIRRLEAIFSLYMPDSAISQLNRDGSLAGPPLDLVRLVSTARSVGRATGGAFDMTIQPLWTLYARHFAHHPDSNQGPDGRNLESALSLVDYRAVDVAAQRIAFAKPGVAISLNGIAQGYITDRVTDLLRANGFENTLVNAGEIRGTGAHPSGRPWRVGIADPVSKAASENTLEITDQAVATSAPMGTPLNSSGTAHHLFDPRTGTCASHHRSITVTAENATLADAYSTAFAVMRWPDIRRVVAESGKMQVDSLTARGHARSVSSYRS